MKKIKFLALATSLAMLAGMHAPVKAQSDININAAGATFPYPLYSKMFSEYAQKTNVKVNYQSIGSGAGQQQLFSKTIDFGASDAYLTDAQMKTVPAPVVHIPTCMGAVVITYNIPNSPKLRFTGELIADIFMGKITKWNDPAIKAVNPGVALPDQGIFVVHRSDGSGTTAIFTDYLSKVNADWKSKVGSATTVNWPVGLGGKGNPGVAGLVQQTPGSIGYVELIYAIQNKMQMADLKNKSGNFVTPSLQTTSVAGNIAIPADCRVSLTNTDAATGYPIASFTFLLFYKEMHTGNLDAAKADAIVKLAWWMIHDGQQYCEALTYAPLPKAAVTQAEANLKSLTFDGKPILK